MQAQSRRGQLRIIDRLSLSGAPILLWLPAALIAVAVTLPIAYLFIRSYQGGYDLWDLIWRDRTLTLLKNTALLTAIVTAASVAISLPYAWLVRRTDLPGRRFWAVAGVLPLAIPSYVGGYTVIAALGPRGMLQGWLEPLGVERLPEIYGLTGASLTLTALIFPYVLITVNAALRGIDPAYEEAARSMGYGPWKTFLFVDIPLLRPAIAAGGLLVALYTIGEFGAVSLLRYDTFTRAIYTQYTNAFDRTLAAGLALLLIGVTVIVLIVEAFTRGRARYYRVSAGGGRPAVRLDLGRWKIPAVLFCGSVVSLSLVMPVGVVIYWLARGLSSGEPLRLVWTAAWQSFYISGLAAMVALIAALPIALVAVRYPSRIASLLERASYSGYALPGIVVALALVFFGANYAPWIYRTIGMLLLAYTVRFLPQAVGTVRTSLLQISPRVEEAARSLGYSGPRTWIFITVPLASKGMLSGAALVFLTVIKELPATLLLRPIGFNTLSTRIWGAAVEGFWARAAAPALILIVISAIAMLLIEGVDRGDE
ncbi:MAG: iron ABC transporter permease [Thermomicrobiales bacterium]